jgi:hypothetical protein
MAGFTDDAVQVTAPNSVQALVSPEAMAASVAKSTPRSFAPAANVGTVPDQSPISKSNHYGVLDLDQGPGGVRLDRAVN